jgi:Fur family transcriptional regulator, zinc uptake regulator
MKTTEHKSGERHDHRRCVARALTDAETICAARGARLTDIRRQVLELVWASHEPVGAYDILGKLARERGGKAAPPTVYRALEFLLEMGLVHRVDSLNAFIGCKSPTEEHAAQFLVCRDCHHVEEIDSPAVQRALLKEVRESGFSLDASSLEVKGQCAKCGERG